MFTDLCILFVAASSLLPVVTHWWHNITYESRLCSILKFVSYLIGAKILCNYVITLYYCFRGMLACEFYLIALCVIVS